MKVHFRFFSFLKQKVGQREKSFDLPSGSTLKEALMVVFEKTGLTQEDLLKEGGIRRNLIVLINGKSVTDLSYKLSGREEVSLMPSIGGGTELKIF